MKIERNTKSKAAKSITQEHAIVLHSPSQYYSSTPRNSIPWTYTLLFNTTTIVFRRPKLCASPVFHYLCVRTIKIKV